MLEVHCKEHLEAVRAYADSQGPEVRKQLEDKLSYLETYRSGACVCRLFHDFAPHSFEFVMLGPVQADGTRSQWFNGGLIHHAPHSNGAGAPEYSVTLTPEAKPHWQIHT